MDLPKPNVEMLEGDCTLTGAWFAQDGVLLVIKKDPPETATFADGTRRISFSEDLSSFSITRSAIGSGGTGFAGVLGGALGGLALGLLKAATGRYFTEVKVTLHSGEVFRLRAEPATADRMRTAFESRSHPR